MGKIVNIGDQTVTKLKDLVGTLAASKDGADLSAFDDHVSVRTVSDLASLITMVEQDLASKRRLLAALSINNVRLLPAVSPASLESCPSLICLCRPLCPADLASTMNTWPHVRGLQRSAGLHRFGDVPGCPEHCSLASLLHLSCIASCHTSS